MANLLIWLSYHSLLWILGAAYIALIIAMVISVLSEIRNPVRSIAWVTALILFPIGGPILYYFFGRSLRNVKMISRRNRRKLLQSEGGKPLAKIRGDISRDSRRCMRLLYSIADSQVYAGNDVTLFSSGSEHFESLFRDLRNAKSYINIQFYIIANDTLGHELRDILVERATAGVKIRVIYDYIGSFDARRRDFFMRMKSYGIEVHSFFRVRFPEKLNRLNWRNHRKVVVIDGEIGYVGGMNVADRYIDGGRRFEKWRDTAVRITGSAVAGLQYNFAVDWRFMGHELLVEEQAIPAGSDVEGREGEIRNTTVQLVTSGPIDRWGNASMLFMRAISQAKKRVFIQTPYFLPSDGLLSALQCASLSGIDVRIMMPLKSDSSLLTHASFSFVEECLLAGIKILLYHGGMLHAKSLLVDDDFSTVGSVNFDFRSFEHNFEENIVMYSHEVNESLAKQFNEDSLLCDRPRIGEWIKRPKSKKIKQALARLLSPIL